MINIDAVCGDAGCKEMFFTPAIYCKCVSFTFIQVCCYFIKDGDARLKAARLRGNGDNLYNLKAYVQFHQTLFKRRKKQVITQASLISPVTALSEGTVFG